MPERILVVGHAAVTCLGRDMDLTWQGLVDGRSGIRRHASLGSDYFLQDVAGIIEDFGPGSATEDSSIAKLGRGFSISRWPPHDLRGLMRASTGSTVNLMRTKPQLLWVRRSAVLTYWTLNSSGWLSARAWR